jgi:hypothetical protein
MARRQRRPSAPSMMALRRAVNALASTAMATITFNFKVFIGLPSIAHNSVLALPISNQRFHHAPYIEPTPFFLLSTAPAEELTVSVIPVIPVISELRDQQHSECDTAAVANQVASIAGHQPFVVHIKLVDQPRLSFGTHVSDAIAILPRFTARRNIVDERQRWRRRTMGSVYRHGRSRRGDCSTQQNIIQEAVLHVKETDTRESAFF